MSLRLPTASGADLVLSEIEGPRRTCNACGREAHRTAQVFVADGVADLKPCGELCGTCIAAALAMKLGAAHLAAGGEVEDLAVPPLLDQDLER
jgi:hypothetical protein